MSELGYPKQLAFKTTKDDTLSGPITLTNKSNKCYIAYKVKSTNPKLFDVVPFHGIINPKDTINVQVSTVDAISYSMAKDLSNKHRFLIEYLLLEERSNIENVLHKFKGPNKLATEIYINTDQMRNSRLYTPPKDSTLKSTISNTPSYHSAIGSNAIKTNSHQPNLSHRLESLKSELEILEQQRSQLYFGASKRSEGGSFIKMLIVLLIGIVLGNLISNSIGIAQLLRGQQKQKGFFQFDQQQQQSSGWF